MAKRESCKLFEIKAKNGRKERQTLLQHVCFGLMTDLGSNIQQSPLNNTPTDTTPHCRHIYKQKAGRNISASTRFIYLYSFTEYYFLKKSLTASLGTIRSSKTYAPVFGLLTIFITFVYARPSVDPSWRVATAFFAIVYKKLLLNLFVKSHLLQDWVILHQFHAVRSVLTVLCCNVTTCTWQTAILHFGALENYLYSVALCFL